MQNTTPNNTPSEALRGWMGATLDSLDGRLQILDTISAGNIAARRQFRAARQLYKRLEAPLWYFGPTVCLAVNGPPSAEMMVDGHVTGRNDAKGLQRIEPVLFPTLDVHAWSIIADEVPRMRYEIRRFRDALFAVRPDDAALLYAARIELARVSTLGIAGFDAPLSRDGIVESAAAVEGTETMLRLGAPAVAMRPRAALLAVAAELRAHPTFDRFDRFRFVTVYANPAFDAIGAARRSLAQPLPALRRTWPLSVDRVYDVRTFDALAYAPDNARPASAEVLALGARSFSIRCCRGMASGRVRRAIRLNAPSATARCGRSRSTAICWRAIPRRSSTRRISPRNSTIRGA